MIDDISRELGTVLTLAAPVNPAETWWDRILAGFTHAPSPQVTGTELAVVILFAVAVSLPRASWRYFGLLATVTHELGHAFAALMTGQRLGGIRLSLDHSGTTTTYSRGGLPAAWSTFWGYPVPAVVGSVMVWCGFNGWGPAAMSVGTLVLLASVVFLRNGIGLLITAATVLAASLLVLFVPAEFNGHVMIALGLALLVAAVRDLGKLANVHLRHRHRMPTSDAYLLYRATKVPAVIWIAAFAAVVAGSWWVAWQPVAEVLAVAFAQAARTA
ncbi:M50 family metallopeptidase [Arthrobacter sp. PAMC25284]|uniref:M50 family metallopeptidase n=1 Tax=Arthrobacter sp. PAMC25284 TaxID=2861279 RepID=UPI001C63842A|nr:M50 family metallopeptidase [Arthrobacter sp. PAMC25284]QYF90264.1 M50 family metallopeptidase [Arthrobacter sp. PAMC25284]